MNLDFIIGILEGVSKAPKKLPLSVTQPSEIAVVSVLSLIWPSKS